MAKSTKKTVKKTNTKKSNSSKVKEEKTEELQVVKEEKTEEELREEFFDSKEDKESKFLKVMNVILWVILFAWMAVCLVDFYKTHKREKPMFTFKMQTVKYDDGVVNSYTGLGYKIYDYKRKCFDGIEYGPFWSKDRSVESDTCSK